VLGSAGVPSANECVHIGVIGLGVRGKYLIGNLPEAARVAAICDCADWKMTETLRPKRRFAQILARFRKHDADRCATYQDYRQMLDRERLDAVTVCHLAILARELNRKLNWDPGQERFVSDPEANALLDRTRRLGFDLPD
jgi:hypothetical protein